MDWYIKLPIILMAIGITLYTFWYVDFAKFIRVDKREFAIFVYVLLSLAIGYLIGKLFIEFGEMIISASA